MSKSIAGIKAGGIVRIPAGAAGGTDLDFSRPHEEGAGSTWTRYLLQPTLIRIVVRAQSSESLMQWIVAARLDLFVAWLTLPDICRGILKKSSKTMECRVPHP
ncbi:hypothetical protein [Mesorhizobium sp. BHbdii]